MKLRYYQQEAIDETLKWLDTQQTHPLIVLPTGSGKTVVFTTIIKQLFDRDPNCRVLILAHRQELVSQAKDKLLSVWPCAPYGILAAGLKEFDASSPVVIASRDTLATPKRLEDAGEFDYIIVDEAHHVGLEKASRYQKIFNNFNTTQHYAPKIFGVTATPYRMGQGFIYGLGDEFFGGVSYQIGIPQLIKDGYLCRLSAFKVDDKAVIDASTARVKFKGGDYRESDLEKLAMEDQTMLAIIADWIDKAYSKGRLSTVFFCVTVAHANKMCMLLQNSGIEAAVVTANTPGDERAEILEKFENGVINALCNVAVLTEGWDAPRTDCIALLRPTKSLGLYVQICGRGMRTWGDKKDCLLLDYGENMNRHGCIDRARPETKAEPEIAKDRVAAEGSVLSDEAGLNIKDVEKIKDVEFARAAIKTSKNGNDYLNVEFKLVDEFWPQSMPFMIGMNGPAGILAKKKWKACAAKGTPVPWTIQQGEELINDHGCFDHIEKITVRKEGRYWNVVSVYY